MARNMMRGSGNSGNAGIGSLNRLDSGRVRLVENQNGLQLELEGTPDMTLEIVSKNSTTKDYEKLRQLYWEAGVQEYWLVDARGDRLDFDILKYTAKGYVATRKQAGWVKSTVFGNSTTVNAAVFFQQLHDFQLNAFNGFNFITENVPEVVSQGVELEVSARPTDELTLTFGALYLDVYYDSTIQFGTNPSDIVSSGDPLLTNRLY